MSVTTIQTVRGVASSNTIDFVNHHHNPNQQSSKLTTTSSQANTNRQRASSNLISSPNARQQQQLQLQQQSQSTATRQKGTLVFDGKGNVTQKAYKICLQIGISEDDLYQKTFDHFKDKASNIKADHDVAMLKYQHYEKRRQQRISQITQFLRAQEEKQKDISLLQLQSTTASTQLPQQQANPPTSHRGSLESRTPILNSSTQHSPKTPLIKCTTRAMKETRVREIFEEIPYDDKMRLVNKIIRVKKRIQVNQRNELAHRSSIVLSETVCPPTDHPDTLPPSSPPPRELTPVPAAMLTTNNAFLTSPSASKGFSKTNGSVPPNLTKDRGFHSLQQPQSHHLRHQNNYHNSVEKEKQELEQRRQAKKERVKEMEEIRATKQVTEIQTQRDIQVRIQHNMVDFIEKEEAKERAAYLKQHAIFKQRNQDRQTRHAQKWEEVETCVSEAKQWLAQIESKHRKNQERKSVSLEKAKRSRSLNHSNMTAIIKQNQILNQQARQQYEQECLKGYIAAKETKAPVRDWSEVRQKREGLQLSALEKRQDNEKLEEQQRQQVSTHLNSKITHANQARQSNIEASYKLINSKNQLAHQAVSENLRFSSFQDNIHREKEEQRSQHKSYIVENRKLLKEDMQYIATHCTKDLGKSLALQELLDMSEFQQSKQQMYHRQFKSTNVSPNNLSANRILKESLLSIDAPPREEDNIKSTSHFQIPSNTNNATTNNEIPN